MIHGIDVSRFNGAVNWLQVAAAGKAYAWMRSSFDAKNVDRLFLQHWPAAKHAGLKRGAYHILHPEQDVLEQAAHFCSLAQGSELPPALDLEWLDTPAGECWSKLPQQARLDSTVKWLVYVEKHLGVRPWIYTSRAFVEQFFPEKHGLGIYPLWIPHYASQITPQDLPAGWADWSAWQTGQGKVAGIAGAVDLDQLKEAAL